MSHAPEVHEPRCLRVFCGYQPAAPVTRASREVTERFASENVILLRRGALAFSHAIWRRRAAVEEFLKGRSLSASESEELRKAIVPPYPLDSFPNRWWKLKKDYPSRTLMAHIGKDTYSHIHYDSDQARVISVREAARLQSFPDGFRFCGAMNSAYKQIGNAVPPLLAQRLAEVMLTAIHAALPKAPRGGRRVAHQKQPGLFAAEQTGESISRMCSDRWR